MNAPSAQAILSGISLVGLLALGVMLVFIAVPNSNHDMLVYILGALSGAITVAGGGKIADKITTSNGPDATVQSDAPAIQK